MREITQKAKYFSRVHKDRSLDLTMQSRVCQKSCPLAMKTFNKSFNCEPRLFRQFFFPNKSFRSQNKISPYVSSSVWHFSWFSQQRNSSERFTFTFPSIFKLLALSPYKSDVIKPYGVNRLTPCYKIYQLIGNGSFDREDNNSSHSQNVESFETGLALICAAFVLLYLFHDDIYSMGVKVGHCTTSCSADKVAKITKNQEEVADPERGREKALPKAYAQSNDRKLMNLEEAIRKSKVICQREKEKLGSPGLVVCVSVDGRQVYAEGFGYADLENEVLIQPDSVMRIASISKSVTAVIVAKLWENGQIDLDKKVQHYLPEFPQKYYLGEKVDITVSQLLNHTSGIRHYKKKDDPAYSFDEQVVEMVKRTREVIHSPFYAAGAVGRKAQDRLEPKMPFDSLKNIKDTEMYSKEMFSSTSESLKLFQNDPLMCKPGSKFSYTTHGFTLLSAIVEAIALQPFDQLVTKTFHSMGMKESYLDRPDPIIYKRARYYMKNKAGRVVNTPYVDNSYKWAGGGLLSTTQDLIKFGNILLYSAQHQEADPGPPGYLKASTVWKFWSPLDGKQTITPRYGLGFELTPGEQYYGMCGRHTFGAGHTGNAVGASSMLFILPRYSEDGQIVGLDQFHQLGKDQQDKCTTAKNIVSHQVKQHSLPQGVVVAVIVNLPFIDLRPTAKEIARIFEEVDLSL